MHPVQWVIGDKIYDPGKIRVFLEAVWARLRYLEKANRLWMKPGQDVEVVTQTSNLTSLVRDIKRGLDQGTNTLETARTLFLELRRNCTLFLHIYFRTMIHQFGGIHEG